MNSVAAALTHLLPTAAPIVATAAASTSASDASGGGSGGGGGVRGGGRVICIYGPMFGGKTSALVATANMFVRCGIDVHIVAPDMSKRKESERERIASHDGVVPMSATAYVDRSALRAHCAPFCGGGARIGGGIGGAARPCVVCIDEAQFFADLVETCCAMRRAGVMVIVAGLTLTFERQPFGEMHALLDYADERIERKAWCSRCNTWNATLTHRTIAAKGTELVGGAESYTPVCQLCFESAVAPRDAHSRSC